MDDTGTARSWTQPRPWACLQARWSRAHEAELDSAIAAYSTCEGAAAIAHVVDAVPSLKAAQTRLASVPTSERDMAFHVRHHSDSDVVAADALCILFARTEAARWDSQ